MQLKTESKLETLNQRALAQSKGAASWAAFEKLLKGRIGPTLYGAEHLKESFAEFLHFGAPTELR